MKTSTINLRLSVNTKETLDKLAYLNEKNVSDIVREAIELYLKNDEEQKNNTQIDLVQTLSFTELIFWLYQKKEDPEITELSTFIEQITSTINEMNGHPLFDSEIMIEFNKVLLDINDISLDREHYSFPKTLNYDKLASFMYCIRYDVDNITKILFIK